ncbi:trypsin-like serine protease [Paraburkholderia sp. NPDC080076]|uniref:trypsin-like serine protease n=1 Tax=Paraburkholderia sp. NPDC080076 TaxID=3390605 RepID=UPI003D06D5C5
MKRRIAASIPVIAGLIASIVLLGAVELPGSDSFVSNTGDLSLAPVRDAPAVQLGPQLAGNSRPADTSKWPASYYGAQGGMICSATVIGPRTVLTALHCVGNNKRITLSAKAGAPITGICHHPDAYEKDHDLSAEYALCRMDEVVQIPRYESVSLDAGRLVKGALLLTTGYGCLIQGGPTRSNQMAIGSMWVGKPAGFDASFPNLLTTDGALANTAFLCQGDSGGGAYVGEENGARVVVAVNAWVKPSVKVSYLASLSTPVAVDFLSKWAEHDGQEICGISKGLTHCVVQP